MNLKIFKKTTIRNTSGQLSALIEKNILLDIRIKSKIITRFINPLIQIFIYLLLFGLLFRVDSIQLGYWNSSNYIAFLLLAYNINLSRSIINKYFQLFIVEKYWNTLSAVLIAPLNRFILLIGILFSELVLDIIPITIIFTITYIISGVSVIFFILTIFLFFCIYFLFASIGLLIGVFAISNEEYVHYSFFFLRIIILLGCLNFPIEVLPDILHFLVYINPFYYVFDLLRLSLYLGMDFTTASSLINPFHLTIVPLFIILAPFVALILFDRIYKKYGITGY